MSEDPTPPAPAPGPPRWAIALLVVTAVAAGLLAPRLLQHAPPPAVPAPPPTDAAGETPADRARRLGAIDSTQKNAWVDEIPGVDVAKLDAARLETFIRFANAERCTCGCGFTLAACRRYDSECDVSGPRVQRLADSIASGPPRDVTGLRPRPARTSG